MIFKETCQQVLDGTKTQTRRPVKPGEKAVKRYRHSEGIDYVLSGTLLGQRFIRKWKVGNDYAVQPGRGKKAVGRIRITKIRRERLQEISLFDIDAEGMAFSRIYIKQVYDFADVWNSLYRKPYRWEDNPEVWVLEFENVED